MARRLALIESRFAWFLVGAAASWGVATSISKRAVDEIPALVLLPVQLSVSVFVLGVAVWAQGGGIDWSPQLWRLGALGVLNPGVSYALSLLGLVHITASMSVLLWAVEPVLILMLAWRVLGERLTRPVLVAAGAALGGVFLVVFQRGTGGIAAGVALTLAGVGACAAYTVICRRWLADDSALAVVLVQQSFALVFALSLLGVAWAAGWTGLPGEVSPTAWLSATASGVLYYGLAFWLYLSGLRLVPATVAGVFLTLVPVFGVAAGYFLLAERLSPRQWIGAVVVVGAVAGLARSRTATTSAGG